MKATNAIIRYLYEKICKRNCRYVYTIVIVLFIAAVCRKCGSYGIGAFVGFFGKRIVVFIRNYI